jgi:prepilin-type N-terminal cleavage/methylation domain-containing protein
MRNGDRERKGRGWPSGLSLLELLAVVTIIGILAVIVLPRFSNSSVRAKSNSCFVNKGNIEIQAQLWFRNRGAWPAADLSDIGTDRNFFPEGLPTCPVDGSRYSFSAASQQVNGHAH